MNNKFSIGVVVAIVLQVSAFVWWTAQQAQTITQLEAEMAELTAKSQVENEINMKRDVEDIKAMLKDLDEDDLYILGEIDQLRQMVNEMKNGSNLVAELEQLKQKVDTNIATLQTHDSWADEYDDDIDSLYFQDGRILEIIDEKIAELDKKLSDRMK
jgi:DNA repair exonuclease SbcCD ATPase subunit